MTKKTFKQVSILLSLLLGISSLAPLAVLAEEKAELIPPPKVVATVERATIGQDFFVEPTMVALEEGDTALDLLKRLVGEDQLIFDEDVGLIAINGTDAGPESVKIPDYIVRDLEGPDTEAAINYGNQAGEGVLGMGSYSPAAQWFYLVNNKTTGKRIDQYQLKEEDVVRFVFTYWGYGADVTGYPRGAEEAVIEIGNKDELIGNMAEVNEQPYLFNSPFVDKAYRNVLGLLATAPISQRMIDISNGFLIITAAHYDIDVQYKTHIENNGWENDWVIDQVSGTTGEALRLEGIQIELQESAFYHVGIRYKTHLQDKGWGDWAENGATSGTVGQARRLEAIKIELTGEDAYLFDVYYQVHAQDVGWMDLAKNGDPAGTEGFSRRLEAIHIEVVPKDREPEIPNQPAAPSHLVES